MYSDVMEERFQKFMRENKGTFEFYDSDSSSSESESEDDEEEWIKISKAMIDSDSENMPNIKIETKSSRTRKRSYVKIICSICGKTMLKASYRKHVRVVHVGTKIEDALASSTLLKSTDVVPVQYSFLDLKKLKANVATKLQKVNTKTSAYKNLKTLLKHKTIHKSSSKMACSICFRILYDQKGLEKHQKFHAGNKQFAFVSAR